MPSATLEALLKEDEDGVLLYLGDEEVTERLPCRVNKPAATECLELLRSRDDRFACK